MDTRGEVHLDRGITPLHMAAWRGHRAAAESAGALQSE